MNSESSPDEVAGPPWPAVETLVPHRPPMLLLERVLEVFEDTTVCLGRVSESGPLAHGGSASIFLGLELAAQTAAAHEALRRETREEGGGDTSPRIGYLASIRDAAFRVRELPAGRPLRARVSALGRAAALSMYATLVTLEEDGSELLSATLSTYLVGSG